jgi:excinuclease UvrABC nuclease subunit
MAKKEQKVYMPLMIGKEFIESEWYTPNTYSENFKRVPNSSGVYLFVTLDDQVLYIGSAKNLFKRYDKHEVKRLLRVMYGRVFFYFKECSNYRQAEIQAIKSFKPLFNTQHNG